MINRKRLLLDNAYYHVMARGNQKQNIFLEDKDYEMYLQLLSHYKRKHKFKLYTWCLMPNHIHLILEINNCLDLSKIMQGLSLAYARRFNKKYGKVGHLWQGRYKSMVIQKERYVLDCISYIEMNPVRADIIQSPIDYAWSSYKLRVSGKKDYLLDSPSF